MRNVLRDTGPGHLTEQACLLRTSTCMALLSLVVHYSMKENIQKSCISGLVPFKLETCFVWLAL